jgi:hypothetical protein
MGPEFCSRDKISRYSVKNIIKYYYNHWFIFFGRDEILEGFVMTAGGRHLAMRARGIEIRPLISCVGEEFY